MYQLIVLEKGLGCSGFTPRSCFPWCTAQDRDLTGGVNVTDCLTTGVELNRLVYSLQGF